MTRSAAMTEPAPGVELGSRYLLEDIAGSGGMATVWRGRDLMLGRPVAVKVISDVLARDPACVTRFAREARTAARISHPNLVRVFDYSISTGRPYLVMEYISGETLARWLDHGVLDEPELVTLAADLLAALRAVHDAGVLHRDVKPSNVLLDQDGRARLTDFGIARMDDTTHLTLPGEVIGTLRYLAPELLHGSEPSPASDLYALGVLLRDAGGESAASGSLGSLITRLTAEQADDRPATAAEAMMLLDAGPAPTRLHPGSTTRSRGRLLPLAALIVVAIALFVIVSSFSGANRAAQPRIQHHAGTLNQQLDQLASAVRAAAQP